MGQRLTAAPLQAVLDASAVLALLFAEPGADHVVQFLDTGAISAVNVAEVVSKLMERDAPPGMVDRELSRLRLRVLPFDEKLAWEAGALHKLTHGRSISLGDRACLATARSLNVPAVTGDRMWADLGLDVQMQFIR